MVNKIKHQIRVICYQRQIQF